MMRRRVQPRGFAAGIAVVLAAAAVAIVTGMLGVMPASSQVQVVPVRSAASVPGDDPFAAFWNDVQPVSVALSAQNVTRPMGGGTVDTLRVRAAHDAKRLYVVSEWADTTEDTTIATTTSYSDAAAVEFPAAGTSRIPAFCMGDPTAGVNIWHWKAVWQNDLDHGFTTNRKQYPDMQVDYYPQADDSTFQTGLAAGNPLAVREHTSPIENLVAAQFGTLTHADVQDVSGVGRWKDGHWRVLFSRPLDGTEGAPSFTPGQKTNAAFAVWNGSAGQRDGIKSVSQFVDLQISGEQIASHEDPLVPATVAFASIMTVLALVGVFGALQVQRARSK